MKQPPCDRCARASAYEYEGIPVTEKGAAESRPFRVCRPCDGYLASRLTDAVPGETLTVVLDDGRIAVLPVVLGKRASRGVEYFRTAKVVRIVAFQVRLRELFDTVADLQSEDAATRRRRHLKSLKSLGSAA